MLPYNETNTLLLSSAKSHDKNDRLMKKTGLLNIHITRTLTKTITILRNTLPRVDKFLIAKSYKNAGVVYVVYVCGVCVACVVSVCGVHGVCVCMKTAWGKREGGRLQTAELGRTRRRIKTGEPALGRVVLELTAKPSQEDGCGGSGDDGQSVAALASCADDLVGRVWLLQLGKDMKTPAPQGSHHWSPRHWSQLHHLATQKGSCDTTRILILGKHPNWHINVKKINSRSFFKKGILWNRYKSTSYKTPFLKVYLATHIYFHHFKLTFFICSGEILQLHLKRVYINQTVHNTRVYLSKNLYVAFMGFERASYWATQKGEHILISKAFVLSYLCAYYLLDVLEIRLALNPFH